MSIKYQGIFIFGEWLDALNQLPAETAMEIINHIYRFDVDDTEPPHMEGGAELVQSIMLAHERRNKTASAHGRKGASARWKSTDNHTTASPPQAQAPLSLANMTREELLAYWANNADTPMSAEDAEWEAQRVERLKAARAGRDAARTSDS